MYTILGVAVLGLAIIVMLCLLDLFMKALINIFNNED